MKIYLTITTIFATVILFGANVPSEKFVAIPANPEFTFASTIAPSDGDMKSKEMSPNMRDKKPPQKDKKQIKNQERADALSLKDKIGVKSPITKSYCLAKYPVTNAEYKEFTDATGHRTPKYWNNGNFPVGKNNHPVVFISLNDAEDYCAWLEKKHSGWHFRLPTEAEWENAASGPKKTAFPWGDQADTKFVNAQMQTKFNFNGVIASVYLKNNPNLTVTFYHPKSSKKRTTAKLSDVISFTPQGGVRGWIDHSNYTGFVYTDVFKKLSDEGGYTTPVNQYPDGKSHYGCFDMSGNTWDWTSSVITATNGAERGKLVNAVRGGSWYANANSCKVTFRGEGRRDQGVYNTVGFRVAAERK